MLTPPTNKLLQNVLPRVMRKIYSQQEQRGDLILAAWPEVIGQKFSPMTEAVSFVDGVLTVRVKNATLYSLLARHERTRLLFELKKRFPKAKIQQLLFRM